MLEAFSNHFLTDAFSSGHVRTPRADLGKYWHEKVPMFFYNFKMFMAEKIAKYVNDHNIRGALTIDTLMFKGAGVFPAGSLDTINGGAQEEGDARDHVRAHRLGCAARLRQQEGRRRPDPGPAHEALRR